MLFDRQDAGIKLATALEAYHNKKETIVIGLPRGGVVLAYEISKKLHLPLDITCPRKIGAPGNKEFAIGAITETGHGIFNTEVIEALQIPKSYLEEEVEREKKIAQYRLKTYRQHLPPRNLKGKTIILVDDGLATGATMEAAIQSVKSEGAQKIVVAVPVAPKETVTKIEKMADEVVCLETPYPFYAIGEFYYRFPQVEDDEVMALLRPDPHSSD